MLGEGSYVRIVTARETRRGTIHEVLNHKGEPQFLFRLDPRFNSELRELLIHDDEVEECERPSDAEIERVNKLIARGSERLRAMRLEDPGT
jgi:hypothetical protein